MLIKLFDLPPLQPALDAIAGHQILVRPARPGEEPLIAFWIQQHFGDCWSRCAGSGARCNSNTLFVAVRQAAPDLARAQTADLRPEQLAGFSCYDSSNKGMLGPLGVLPEFAGKGIGKALLLTALHAMRAENCAYAVIGWAGPVAWCQRIVGASVIPEAGLLFRGRFAKPVVGG